MTSEAGAEEVRRFDEGGPSLSEVGEAVLLQRVREAAFPAAQGLAVPPGDDAAVWIPPPGVGLALSQDALVEGVDFRRAWIAPRRLGRRSVEVALSDLAGMGATPAWCSVTLCAPRSTQLEDCLEIERGIVEGARAAACAVAGGDVSDTAGPLVIDVAVGGTLREGACLRRDAGRVGDLLLVTGELGGAAAGLAGLEGEAAGDAWVRRLLDPRARIAEGRRLAEAGVRCGGDISDGLVAEAARTAAASRCGAELWLDGVPAAPGLSDAFPVRWAELALAGGEDFELLAAAAPAVVDRVRLAWPVGLAPLHIVGRLIAGEGVRLLSAQGGRSIEVPQPRSRHWR